MRTPGLVLCTALLTLLATLVRADDLAPSGADETAVASLASTSEPTEASQDSNDRTLDQAANETPNADARPASPPSACIKQCNAAETRCSSQVRRARQECSKRAANAGRDPMRAHSDYAYFCGYFSDPGACGSDRYRRGCQNRFVRAHGLCVDKMYGNIAAMRYDCYLSERDAQSFCRSELRDCRAACADE